MRFLLIIFLVLPLVSFAADKKPLYWIDPMEPNVHYDHPGKSSMGMDVVPIYADDENKNGTPTIKINPAVVNNLGVRTTAVTQGSLAREIQTVGFVDANENAITHVHTYTDGWIEQLLVRSTGEAVTKNQLLFRFYSPTLVNAQAEYLIALDSNNAHIVHASEQKLSALGIASTQIEQLKKTKKPSRLIDVFSPQNGVVTTLNVREGNRITSETDVMTITDLATIWVMVEVYESEAPWVHVGQTAEATLPYLPDKVWRGQVEYIYPTIDPKTRTLKLRLRFENPEGTLKPNMYANIRLSVTPKENTISIPIEALIRTENSDRVIVDLGNGRFEPRIVQTGIETSDRVEIVSGLKPGEKVVTSAQFLIDSEANLKGALERLQSNTTPTQKPVPQENSVMAQGIIKSMDPVKHTMTIQHQPIPALGWPAMTMSFQIKKEIAFYPFKVNQEIQFVLQKDDKDQWIVIMIHPIPMM